MFVPVSDPPSINLTMLDAVVVNNQPTGSLASRFPSAFSERMAMLPPDRRFQSYSAVPGDTRRSLEEGRGRGGNDEEEEEEEGGIEYCPGCCHGPRKAIKYTRLFVQAWLFISAVVVFVGSLKEGKEGRNT